MAKSTDSQKPQAQGPQKQKPQGQKPQKQDPQGQKPQKQKPQGQKPQKQDPQGQKPQKQDPQGQKPQKQDPQGQKPQKQDPQGQKPQKQKPQKQDPQKQSPQKQSPQKQSPQSKKSQSDSKDSMISKNWKMIIGVIIFIAMIVAVVLLVVFSGTKENLQLPPQSPQDLINPITQAKNKFNIYSSENNYIVNSDNWNIVDTKGFYGTDSPNNAGKPGTNFTFLYPTEQKEGAQIVNDKGYCLDTNPFQPGSNPNIISQSWWWNPVCFSTVAPDQVLRDGQVGFQLNKNNQLEFKKNGMCLDNSNMNKKAICKQNKENINTFYNIEQFQTSDSPPEEEP